jgi:RNA polymerase sigma factor (sigma-70 family)
MAVDAGQRAAARAERAARLAACLQRARDGERAALDEAVRELNPLLWHVARSQGLGTEEAADVVQTTWLELLRALDRIRTPEALTAWLVTTARRESWRVREQSRRQVPDSADALDGTPDPDPEPGERLLADERDRLLWRHFQRLPQRCRELLRVVAEVDRPDYARIAEALDMPHGSIGPTRGRCLAKLRALLAADPSWSAP